MSSQNIRLAPRLTKFMTDLGGLIAEMIKQELARAGITDTFINAANLTGSIGSGVSGAVTSVGLSMPSEFAVSGSPVTGSGTLSVSKANESANTVYAGPNSGGATAPTFRALVVGDLPFGTNGQRLISTGSAAAYASEYVYVTIPLGNGSTAITTGTVLPDAIGVPVGTLVEARLVTSGNSGSVTADILRCTYAGFPTFASIVGAGTKPNIANAATSQKYSDTTFTSWTATTFVEGDMIRANVTAAATLVSADLILKIMRTD